MSYKLTFSEEFKTNHRSLYNCLAGIDDENYRWGWQDRMLSATVQLHDRLAKIQAAKNAEQIANGTYVQPTLAEIENEHIEYVFANRKVPKLLGKPITE